MRIYPCRPRRCRIMTFRSALVLLWMLAAFAVAASVPALADSQAVGLVSQAEGQAVFLSAAQADDAAGQGERLEPFMQMYLGDVIRLGDDGRCRVVFYASGFQETWLGPVAVRLDASNGVVVSADAPGSNETAMLPTSVTQALGEASIPLRRADTERFGMVAVRGLSGPDGVLSEQALAEIGQAETAYEDLKARTDPKDVVAELYLIGVLHRHGAMDRLAEVAAAALEKRPDSEWLKGLAAKAKALGVPASGQ